LQKIKIYYHEDLDGIFSSILYSKLLLDNDYRKIKFEYKGVNYDNSDWQDRDLREKDTQIVIVDYPYNSSSNLWFDHHPSGWGKIVPTEFVGNFEDKAPSCCQVIYNTPSREKFRDEELIQKIVKEVNMIDYALYPDIDTVYNPKTFGPKFRLAEMEDADENYRQEIIKMFSNDRTLLYRLLDGYLPWSVEWRYSKIQNKLEEGYREFVKVAKLEDDIVTFEIPKYHKFDRYFPFRWKPESIYTAYIRDMSYFGKGWHVAISQNPWNQEKRRHNIKEICEKYGGGGHEGVGGIHIDQSMDRARQVLSEVKEMLKI